LEHDSALINDKIDKRNPDRALMTNPVLIHRAFVWSRDFNPSLYFRIMVLKNLVCRTSKMQKNANSPQTGCSPEFGARQAPEWTMRLLPPPNQLIFTSVGAILSALHFPTRNPPASGKIDLPLEMLTYVAQRPGDASLAAVAEARGPARSDD
jgi:hypothetical protein